MSYVDKLTLRVIVMSFMPKKKTKEKFFKGYRPYDYFKIKDNPIVRL